MRRKEFAIGTEAKASARDTAKSQSRLRLPPGKDILEVAYELEQWAYGQLNQHPDRIDLLELTRTFLRLFMTTHAVWAAIQLSPRRLVSGTNSAVKFLGNKIPVSSLYKFLADDLGFNNDEKRDRFRECKSMEQVLEICPRLNDLAKEVCRLYKKHCVHVSTGTP